MKVVVIDSDGKRLAEGEWDGRKIDDWYARVGSELYHCGYVYLAEHALTVETNLAAEAVSEGSTDEDTDGDGEQVPCSWRCIMIRRFINWICLQRQLWQMRHFPQA